MADAYLLVSHGSRDPRPQLEIDRLSHQLSLWLHQAATDDSPILVATAQLELAEQPLHVQICDFALTCAASGISRIAILPLFLVPGVHVMADIPTEVDLAASTLCNAVSEPHHSIELMLLPFLGADSTFANLFAQNRSSLPERAMMLAHGSRRAGGNAVVEQLASSLNLKVAYWSVAPSLSDTVAVLVAAGATEIGILPYFLFTGGITEAIATAVAQLTVQFPQVRLSLGAPIGTSPELVATIGQILQSIAS
ncbi:sirohydrochlorin chelatase [Chamaesiphon sp.]|uniref:sirohydrochlorin chelatase n=1 Tax=Chamaesiphon sp. TaxID=2814140 RepID=UPI003592F552